jgi:DNA-binding transcriptional regulator YiaG
MKHPADDKTSDLLSKAFRGPYAKKATARTFGAFVAHRRALRRMTQSDYAASLNISRRALIDLEKRDHRPRYPRGVEWFFARAEFKGWGEMVLAFEAWQKEAS